MSGKDLNCTVFGSLSNNQNITSERHCRNEDGGALWLADSFIANRGVAGDWDSHSRFVTQLAEDQPCG